MAALRFVSHGLTHVGLVRRRNEDALLDRPERGLWAVADGMGGHEAGDYASARIVAALDALSSAPDLGKSVEAAVRTLHDVDLELQARAARLGSGAVIASTVVALLASGDESAVIWAGDSRLYRWRPSGRNGDEFRQLTVDHSQVQEMVEAGLLRPDQAARHPMSHIVTRAVGAGPVEFAVRRDALLPGDRLVLCSDGLTNMVSDAEIARDIGGAAPQWSAERLRDLVLERGAIDNVTIIVVATEPA
jgi:serine/threonine protein phosphatase PrpC